MQLPSIPIFWDVDLTITKRYQQVPLFSHYEERIKEKLQKHGISYAKPEDYFKYVDELKNADAGVAYLQQMLWDSQPGGIFEGLTTTQLYNFGKEIEPATGFVDGIKVLRERFIDKATLHHFFVSVGITDMIKGFIIANNLDDYVSGVAASSFFSDDKDRITGIRRVVSPFTKNEWIIGFMKGDATLLNKQLGALDYRFSYEKMIVIGDGQTDTSKFAYAKKKGGTPCAVYEPNNQKSFEKAQETVGMWVDYLMPRDYTPGYITLDLLTQAIDEKLSRRCQFSSVALHGYKKGTVTHAQERELTATHLGGCIQCQGFFSKYTVTPDNNLSHTRILEPESGVAQLSLFPDPD